MRASLLWHDVARRLRVQVCQPCNDLWSFIGIIYYFRLFVGANDESKVTHDKRFSFLPMLDGWREACRVAATSLLLQDIPSSRDVGGTENGAGATGTPVTLSCCGVTVSKDFADHPAIAGDGTIQPAHVRCAPNVHEMTKQDFKKLDAGKAMP